MTFDPDQDVDHAEHAAFQPCRDCGGPQYDGEHAEDCPRLRPPAAFGDTANLSTILASDFSNSMSDVLRDHWTAGKFRALAAVVGDDNRIILTTDRGTGHTSVVELMGVQPGSHGGRVVVRHHYPSGSHDVAYRCRDVGAAVIVAAGVKWAALTKHRELCAECIDVVRREYGEVDGQAHGTWSAHLTDSGAYVKYEPSTGNAAFREEWGQQVTADVWRDRDGTLTAWNVRKYPPRVLCDQPPTPRT